MGKFGVCLVIAGGVVLAVIAREPLVVTGVVLVAMGIRTMVFADMVMVRE